MRNLLEKCSQVDLDFLFELVGCEKDGDEKKKKWQRVFKSVSNRVRPFRRHGAYSSTDKDHLICMILEEFRYRGSSDIAYRWRRSKGKDPGAPDHEIVDDARKKLNKIKKLRVPAKIGRSEEATLKRMAEALFEKEFKNIPTEKLGEILKERGVGIREQELILEYVKGKGKAAILPFLFKILGRDIALKIIEAFLVNVITQIIGREAAKAIFRELIKRNPWINAFGPIMWAITIGWAVFDLQGPAYRKTIPFCLFLGLVLIREE